LRGAISEAVLWDAEHRWFWVRGAVRRALSDNALQDDGPLQSEGQTLPVEAISDLHAWAADKGILAVRAALSLGAHYKRVVEDRLDDELIERLETQLANPHAPTPLRMELAKVLQKCRRLSPELLTKLLDLSSPAPLRLIAADGLLAEGDHAEARAALHDIARLPNREMALATAEVVQRRLGVDLSLAVGQPLPAVHTRQAAEVTRRVMAWAAQQEPAMRGREGEPALESQVSSATAM
jgi:hypothetical protein